MKHFVRRSLYRAGWDVRRVHPQNSELWQLAQQLSVHKIDTVLDVGANAGQFAEKLRDAGFSGRIVSFEPSTAAHSILDRRARHDTNWVIAPRMALGDHDGTITLNLAGNSASSSVLPMLSSHVNAEPKSRYVGSESVDLRTLDNIAMNFVSEADRVFVKLDVQGFEYKVLQGAGRFLTLVRGIQLEFSLVPLYDGELLFHDMLHELEERGFELWSVIPGLTHPNTCRLLQMDGVFFRKGASLATAEIKPEAR